MALTQSYAVHSTTQTFYGTLADYQYFNSIGNPVRAGTVIVDASTTPNTVLGISDGKGSFTGQLTNSQLAQVQALVSGAGNAALAASAPLRRILQTVRSPRYSMTVSSDAPTVALQTANAAPGAWVTPLSNAVRHMAARTQGSGGLLDLNSVVYRYAPSIYQAQGGSYQCNDGTNSAFYMPGSPSAPVGAENFTSAVTGFVTDSPYFGIPHNISAGRVLLLIDGKPHAETPATMGNGQYMTFAFGARRKREIVVIAGPYGRLAEVCIGPNDTISPFDTTTGSFTAGVMTDSYGQVASSGFASFYDEALYRVGCINIVRSSVGGTGYSADNSGALGAEIFPASSRLAYMLSQAPDMGLFAGGINDAWPTGAYGDTAAGIAACMSAYRAAVPTGLMLALAPFAPSETVGQGSTPQAIRAAILSRLQADTGPWVFIDNLNGGWLTSWGNSGGYGRWQTGTGKNGTTTGSGNGDLYVSSDGVHPSTAGADYLAVRLSDQLRQAILSLSKV